jgi:hypothetical protein
MYRKKTDWCQIRSNSNSERISLKEVADLYVLTELNLVRWKTYFFLRNNGSVNGIPMEVISQIIGHKRIAAN